MGEKAIMRKVLSCLVVSVLLMSTFSVAVLATDSSNSTVSNVTAPLVDNNSSIFNESSIQLNDTLEDSGNESVSIVNESVSSDLLTVSNATEINSSEFNSMPESFNNINSELKKEAHILAYPWDPKPSAPTITSGSEMSESDKVTVSSDFSNEFWDEMLPNWLFADRVTPLFDRCEVNYTVRIYKEGFIPLTYTKIGERSFAHYGTVSYVQTDLGTFRYIAEVTREEDDKGARTPTEDDFLSLMEKFEDVEISNLTSIGIGNKKSIYATVQVKVTAVIRPEYYYLSPLAHVKNSQESDRTTKSVTLYEDPEPDLSYSIVSSPIYCDSQDEIWIMIDCANKGGKAGGYSTVSVSFPNLTEKDDLNRFDIISDFADPNGYKELIAPGDTIWEFNGNDKVPRMSQTTAKYVIAETGTTSNGRWDSGDTHSFHVVYHPTKKDVGSFHIYIRATFTSLSSASNHGVLFTDPSSSGANDQQNFYVKDEIIKIKQHPKLCCEPSGEIDFGSIDWGRVGISKDITISNCGGEILHWGIYKAPSWLSFSPNKGSLSAEESEVVKITIDPSGLTQGQDYVAPFTIATNAASPSVWVRCHINKPELDVNPQELDFGEMNVGKEKSLPLYIKNTGEGILGWSIVALQFPDWIDFTSYKGTVDAGKDDCIGVIVNTEGLTAGQIYSEAFSIVSNGGTKEVTVKVQIIELPKLRTSPDPPSPDFGTVPKDQTRSWDFFITNCGSGTLTWSVSCDQSWISVNPTSDSTTKEVDVVTVTIDTHGLTPGTHTGHVTVTSNGGSKTGTITVKVPTPPPQPKLCTSPDPPSHDFGIVSKEKGTSWSFGIRNCGSGTLTWSVSDDKPWMTVYPTSGSTTTETDTVTVTIDMESYLYLSPGTHTGHVTINSNGGSKTGTITVNVPTPPPQPKLCTSPDPPSHNFGTVSKDQTRSWNFDITNCGDGTLTWSVSCDQSWIRVNPTSDSTTTEADVVTVTIDSHGLTPGTHTGHITITSNGGSKTGTITVEVQKEPEKLPDLVLYILDITPNPCKYGTNVNIHVQYGNAGKADVGPFYITVKHNGKTLKQRQKDGLEADWGSSEDITLENVQQSGDYQVCLDGNNEIQESNENNNCLTEYLDVSEEVKVPDLVASKLEISPNPCSFDDNVDIWFTVKNQGDGDAGPHKDSLDIYGVPSDCIEFDSSGLQAGESETWHYVIRNVPKDSDGYYIYATADDGMMVPESYEGNNRMYGQIVIKGKESDLTIRSMQIDPNPCIPTDTVSINYELENRGKGKAIGFDIMLLFEGEIVKADHYPGSMTPGEIFSRSFLIETPHKGKYTVWVDHADNIKESDEDNNCASAYLEIKEKEENQPPVNPTLTPDKSSPQTAGTTIKWTASATDPDGDTLYYRFWLKGPATGDSWQIKRDWSTTNAWTWHTTSSDVEYNDISVWIRDGHHAPTSSFDLERIVHDYKITAEKQRPTAKIDSITSNPATQGIDTVHFKGHGTDKDGYIVAYYWTSSIDGRIVSDSEGSEEFEMPASELSVGTHTIYFKVRDNDDQWSEWDTATLTIKPSAKKLDLIVSSLTFNPNPANKGDNVVVSVTVKNQGKGDAGPHYEFLGYPDRYTCLKEWYCSGLKAGASRTFTHTLKNVQHSDTYRACADIKEEIQESNEDNNCLNAHLTVQSVSELNYKLDEYGVIQQDYNDDSGINRAAPPATDAMVLAPYIDLIPYGSVSSKAKIEIGITDGQVTEYDPTGNAILSSGRSKLTWSNQDVTNDYHAELFYEANFRHTQEVEARIIPDQLKAEVTNICDYPIYNIIVLYPDSDSEYWRYGTLDYLGAGAKRTVSLSSKQSPESIVSSLNTYLASALNNIGLDATQHRNDWISEWLNYWLGMSYGSTHQPRVIYRIPQNLYKQYFTCSASPEPSKGMVRVGLVELFNVPTPTPSPSCCPSISISTGQDTYMPGDNVYVSITLTGRSGCTFGLNSPSIVSHIAPTGETVTQTDMAQGITSSIAPGGHHTIGRSMKLPLNAPLGRYDVKVSLSGGKCTKTANGLFLVVTA